MPIARRLPSVDVVVGGGSSRAIAATSVAVVAAIGLVDPLGLAPFGPVKWAGLTTALLAIGAFALDRRTVVERSTLWAWTAFLAIAALAAAFGRDRLYAWTGTPERHFGWLTWLLCALAFTAGQQLVRRRATGPLRAALVGLTAVAGGIAILELAGARPFGDLVGTSGRPGALMGSSAFLGALLVLIAPTAIASAFDSTARASARTIATGTAACAGVALIASGARAAWIGAAVAAAVGAVALRGRRRRGRAASGRAPRSITTALTALTVVLLAAISFVASGAATRVTDVFTSERGGVQGRLDEWRVAAHVIADRPLLGTGPEGYRIAFPSAVDASYEETHGRDPLPDRAHSAPLDVATTTGIPGLLAYATLMALLLVRMARAITDDRHPPATVALAAGVVGYLGQSLFLFPLAEVDPLAWLMAGVVVASTQRETDHVRALPMLAGRVAKPAFALAAMVAAVLGALDVAADRAARATLDDVADGIAPSDPDRAAQLRPDAIRYRLVAVRGHERSVEPGSFGSAIGQLDAARRLSPRDPVVRNERARVLLARAAATEAPDDIALAVAALDDLARDDPNNRRVRAQLSIARSLEERQADLGT